MSKVLLRKLKEEDLILYGLLKDESYERRVELLTEALLTVLKHANDFHHGKTAEIGWRWLRCALTDQYAQSSPEMESDRRLTLTTILHGERAFAVWGKTPRAWPGIGNQEVPFLVEFKSALLAAVFRAWLNVDRLDAERWWGRLTEMVYRNDPDCGLVWLAAMIRTEFQSFEPRHFLRIKHLLSDLYRRSGEDDGARIAPLKDVLWSTLARSFSQDQRASIIGLIGVSQALSDAPTQ